MSSKWINKDLFNEFQEQKKAEADSTPTGGMKRSDLVWKTPEKGTTDKAKVYEGRFVPDKKGNFYMKYFYHMFLSGDQWTFTLCPKTFNFNDYCPLCSATSKLYTGSAADKKMASNYKRKEKFVSNIYIIDDPRDSEADDDDKVSGSVRLYEFPGKVEMKLKEEITDTRNGLGAAIFDPGENGFNFLLKVLSTKKDKNGNIWPDYSSSAFTRRASALGSDAEIEKIMDSTMDLNEYVQEMKKSDDDIIELLKAEMIWEIVQDEWNRYKASKATEPTDIDDSQWDSVKSEGIPEQPEDSEEMSDASLLAELENL